ncbi:dipeptide transport system permease protein DppC [Compostibacillus humi]|uniref:Dipeptide transport system permease protein DppC n=1 Tax=Compostibacillus humi TaxID=1245525 RepID=A0A8J3EJD4_9BACI|nr:ABC transporter permease [Compostibacillus humi]GGH71037.1 dipeptide transport system permease protein DppC [Compostibacillus humi]
MKQAEEVTKLSPANVPDEWFTFIEVDKTEAETVSRPSLSYWKDAWRRLRMNKMAMMGLVFLVLLTFMAIFGPMMTPYDVNVQDRPNQYQPPSAEHWFGTDNMGRDVFTRTWYGARISLFVGFVAAIIDVFIGIIWGGISGYKGGRTDNIMMRIIEILYGIPSLLVTILLLVVFGPSLFTIILALAITGWVGMARIVRGQVLQIKNYEFVQASKSYGAKSGRIIRKHLLPNTMGPIIVQMTLSIPTAIFAEAFLSFIGLGVQAPYASWGVMANDSLGAILSGNWWTLFFPAFFISFTMFAFNVLGDGLQDALDPRLRK